jgi:hypothetical protein
MAQFQEGSKVIDGEFGICIIPPARLSRPEKTAAELQAERAVDKISQSEILRRVFGGDTTAFDRALTQGFPKPTETKVGVGLIGSRKLSVIYSLSAIEKWLDGIHATAKAAKAYR